MTSLRRSTSSFVLVLCGLLAFAACGGQVTTGGTGAGGHGGQPPTPKCPQTEPHDGDSCAVAADQTCSYGPCCPSVYMCAGGAWQSLDVDCIAPADCSPVPPSIGAACNLCAEASPCTYPCPGSSAQIVATCSAGAWSLDGTCPVPPPVDCNGVACQPGEICVRSAGGPGFSFACTPDPCFPAPLSCDCAQALCGAPFICSGATAQELFCDCPTCP